MSFSVQLGSAVCLFAGAAVMTLAANLEQDRENVSKSTQPMGTLVFSGGYETDPGGRPVTLIGPALGVPPAVFREAFRNVQPARGGKRPTSDQVRKNKAILLRALTKYGVTNERLDEVSDYYRYRPEKGERWPTTPAKGYAKIENGTITGFVITQGGSGYSSPPIVRVMGMPGVIAKVKLSFGKNLKANGAITEVTLAGAKQPGK
jgi:hypothetical protein